MKPKLTEGQVPLQLLALTLPMVWGIFAVLAFSLADTYFVAQLGTKELAAISFTFPVVTVLGSVAMGLGTGASSVIARAIGEGNRRQVQRLTTDSLLLSLLIVVFLASLGLATVDPLFAALGAGSELLPLIRDYMEIWYLGMVFLVIPLVGNSAIRASGNTLLPSLIMTLAAAANILLDPLFIFGWGPFPALGIKGAAIASTIARAGTLLTTLAFLHFRERLSSSAFNALGQPLPALGMSLSRLLLLYVPLAYLGSQLFGLPGIFIAASLSNGRGTKCEHLRHKDLGQSPSEESLHRQWRHFPRHTWPPDSRSGRPCAAPLPGCGSGR